MFEPPPVTADSRPLALICQCCAPSVVIATPASDDVSVFVVSSIVSVQPTCAAWAEPAHAALIAIAHSNFFATFIGTSSFGFAAGAGRVPANPAKTSSPSLTQRRRRRDSTPGPCHRSVVCQAGRHQKNPEDAGQSVAGGSAGARDRGQCARPSTQCAGTAARQPRGACRFPFTLSLPLFHAVTDS